MKKLLIRPRHIVMAFVVAVLVIGGAMFALNANSSNEPKLSPEEKALQKRVKPLTDCLKDANDSEAEESIIAAAREKCLTTYPDL
ncbi:MAG: hypothetical protein WAS36_01140 [Candidatus Saccharimonadales bacterium]